MNQMIPNITDERSEPQIQRALLPLRVNRATSGGYISAYMPDGTELTVRASDLLPPSTYDDTPRTDDQNSSGHSVGSGVSCDVLRDGGRLDQVDDPGKVPFVDDRGAAL